MHRSGIESPALLCGPLLAWDARAKLLLLAGYLITLAVISQGSGAAARAQFLLLFLLLGALILHSRVSCFWILSRSVIILPFAGFLALAHLVVLQAGPDVFVHLPWTDFGLRYHPEGLERAALLLARAWLALLATLLLLGTTPILQIFRALERLRVPNLIVLLLALVSRYSVLLLEEMRRMWTAMQLRSAGGSLRKLRRAGAGMIAVLFARTLERGQRVHQAMLLRGYAGSFRGVDESAWSRADILRFTAGLLLLLAIACWPSRFWPWKFWPWRIPA